MTGAPDNVENRAQLAGTLAQLAQHARVMIRQSRPRLIFEARPTAAFWHFSAAFVRHFQEQQIGELLDIIAVIDAVVAERVAKAPKFLDDVRHAPKSYMAIRVTKLQRRLNHG